MKRVADEEVLIADIKLSNAQTLATVNVAADGPRQQPGRNDANQQPGVSGVDRNIAGALIPPELAGNLSAMASTIPGVQLIPGVDGNPDRFSIFGLDGAQNNSSLNGQQSGVSNIPRDAGVSSQVRSGYDVANGGFSGAQINVSTQSGTNYIARSASGDQAARTNASILGSIDWAAKSPTSGHAFNIAYNGAFSAAGPQSTSLATQTPASLAESRNMSGGLQLRHTNYFGSGVLTESMLSATGSRYNSDPYLTLSGGTVLVTSTLGDGTATARSLGFGGSANNSSSTNASLSGRNMLSWFSGNNKHRLKLITELRIDRASSEQAFNLLGRFTYQSLADLEAGIPSSYSRALNAVTQSGTGMVGAVAVGDAWRPTQNVQVQYGIRFDGNRFLTTPSANPLIRDAFGVSNTNVPNRVYVSPRVGFSWLYGTAPAGFCAATHLHGRRHTDRGLGCASCRRGRAAHAVCERHQRNGLRQRAAECDVVLATVRAGAEHSLQPQLVRYGPQ